MPEGIIKLTNEQILQVGKPLDYSFRGLNTIEGMRIEGSRDSRVGAIPRKSVNRRFLTRSIWLNNNSLSNIQYVDDLIRRALERPEQLGWIDFSFNYIKNIDKCLTQFPNISIIYFHGNLISDMDNVAILRPLKRLKSITFRGNPISDNIRYRYYVITYLPQVENLDFTPITPIERHYPKPPDAVEKIDKTENA